jgi:hypothetical protein
MTSFFGILAAALLVMSCGTTVEAGFANAPSIQRQTRPRNAYDTIANGPESCPDVDVGHDPLAMRVPPCTTTESRP